MGQWFRLVSFFYGIFVGYLMIKTIHVKGQYFYGSNRSIFKLFEFDWIVSQKKSLKKQLHKNKRTMNAIPKPLSVK